MDCSSDEMNQKLVEEAYAAMKHAYAPYSHFRVGAALLTKEGKIFTGCNIENASYGATNCAERTAFFKAVSEGERSFTRIAVVGNYPGKPGDYCAPCGVCRQVMREFCDPETFEIIIARGPEDYKSFILNELVPESFGPDDLV